MLVYYYKLEDNCMTEQVTESAHDKICRIFDNLIQVIHDRKRELLEKLQGLTNEFEKRNEQTFDTIKSMTESKMELENVIPSVKGNFAVEKMERNIAEFDKKIKDLQSKIVNTNIHFFCQFTQLKDDISNFGEIYEMVVPKRTFSKVTFLNNSMNEQFYGSDNTETNRRPFPKTRTLTKSTSEQHIPSHPVKEAMPTIPTNSDTPTQIEPLPNIREILHEHGPPLKPRKPSYRSLDMSVVTKFRPKIGKEMYPNGICIHEKTNRVFICDNNKVQVWTIEGKYLSEFGTKDMKNPYGIVIQNDYLFITDIGKSCIFKFSLANYYAITNSKLTSPGYTHIPDHITASSNEIFVATNKPNISVFNSDLKFVRALETEGMSFTTGILIHNNVLFILELERDLIHLLNSQSGVKISQIVTNKYSIPFTHANNFCMDKNCDLFITDLKSNLIKKVDIEGSFLKTFDTAAWECFEPNAIAITDNNKIVVTFRSGGCSHLLLEYF
ncbi:E3 ubiquitin-protein ligase TRIM71-like [Oopsacas minuta]|uniref:E3 ubiquitin-protein ligase TRIM71-like n=1 Tax=Oopsacas minuta TaxID=111878 RepID=A0AAV7KAM8_9METZ|nr:E3 ubiquitin-protein ligase TRIM71-like [Oopsacas minuta]